MEDNMISYFKLQLFADDEGEKQQEEQAKAEQPKTFTQEELNAIIEKRLAKEKTKLEEERKALLTKAEQEKELAKLSEKERAAKEFELKQSEFEKERQEFQKQKLELETVKELDKRGLPVEFSSMVLGDDSEGTLEKINSFEKQWQSALDKAVSERMRGTTPNKATDNNQAITKEVFDKMGYNKRLEFKQSNPELYAQYVGG